MNAGAKLFRSLMFAGLVILAGTGAARAATDPTSCVNDTDCIATPGCGGEVCDFLGTGKCIPAKGGTSQGMEGWCSGAPATQCKCALQGATCNSNSFCTITVPPDGGAAGSGAAGTGAAGTGAAGTTGAAGATTDAGTKPASSSSGCAVGGSTSGALGALVGLALVAGGLARRRRRA
jgi:MYXO-CTERM domain-containing protein